MLPGAKQEMAMVSNHSVCLPSPESDIDTATSSDPGVVQVIDVSGQELTLRAKSPGRATIKVAPERAEYPEKSVGVTVISKNEVDRVEFDYYQKCGLEEVVIPGEPFPLEATMHRGSTSLSGDETRVIVPDETAFLASSPAGRLEPASVDSPSDRAGHGPRPAISSTTWLQITDEGTSSVTLESKLDGSKLPINLRSHGAVSTLRVDDSDYFSDGDVMRDAVDRANSTYSLARMVNRREVCSQVTSPQIENHTGDTCDASLEHGYILGVDGLSQGLCHLSIRYPKANGGAGMTVDFRIDRAR
jgi:hypothetical protein